MNCLRFWLLPLLLLPFAGFVSCSSSGEPKPEVGTGDAVNDDLISFTVNAQSGRFNEAIAYLTYRDQLKLIDANGNVKEEYKLAMKRVRISSLQQRHFMVDGSGLLEGMVAVLDEANRGASISDEERSLTTKDVPNPVVAKPVAAKSTVATTDSTSSAKVVAPTPAPQAESTPTPTAPVVSADPTLAAPPSDSTPSSEMPQ